MAMTFPCPACGQTIGANVAPGTLVRCPLCQQSVEVPGGAATGGMVPPSISGPPQFFNAPPPLPTAPRAGLAIWALVLGLCSLFPCLFFLGLPALICAFIALARVSRDPQSYRGRGMAIGGLCVGLICLVGYPLLVMAIFPTAMRDSCRNNMVQIDLALKNYDKAERKAPRDVDALVSKDYLFPQFALCLSGMLHGVQPSYHYVPGDRLFGDPHRIIVYEDPRNHGNEGGHVLHADGQVEFLSAAELAEAIDRLESSSGAAASEEAEQDDDAAKGDDDAAEEEDSAEESHSAAEDASSNAD